MCLKECIQLNFTSLSHKCLETWPGYRGGNDKSDEPPSSFWSASGARGASTCTDGTFETLRGKICVLYEDESGDA